MGRKRKENSPSSYVSVASLGISLMAVVVSAWTAMYVSRASSSASFAQEKLVRLAEIRRSIIELTERDANCIKAWPFEGSWDSGCQPKGIDMVGTANEISKVILVNQGFFSPEGYARLNINGSGLKPFEITDQLIIELDEDEYAGWVGTVLEVLDSEERRAVAALH